MAGKCKRQEKRGAGRIETAAEFVIAGARARFYGTHRMKTNLLTILAALAMLAPAWARMGDTYERAVERYGDPVAAKDGELEFRKLGFRIFLTLHEGRVDSVIYSRPTPITRAEAEKLVDLNGGKDWEQDKDGWAWRSKDRKTVVHWRYDSTTLLVVTEAHRERQREKQRKALEGL